MRRYISFTENGLNEIKNERDKISSGRKEAVENLRIAREMGDLSENAAYRVARAKLSSIDSRLRYLNYLIRTAKVISPPTNQTIGIGSKVFLTQGDKEIIYEIVGSFESDPLKGKISDKSPLGKELIGRKSGMTVKYSTPAGNKKFKIIRIA